jgi:HEPN domain-containing protein
LSEEEVNSLRRSPRKHVQTYKFHSSHAIYALAISNLKRALQLNVKASLLKEGVEYPQTNSVRRLLELLANV